MGSGVIRLLVFLFLCSTGYAKELEPCLNQHALVRKGFRPDFAICWTNDKNHTIADDTFRLITNPKTYDPKYGNPITGVLLNPSSEKNKTLVVHQGNLYLVLGSTLA